MISESIRRRGVIVGEVSYKGHRYPAEISRLRIAVSPVPLSFTRSRSSSWSAAGAVNLAGAQRDRGVQGLGGLGVGGMGQAAAVSPVTSFQTANRRVISVR